MLLGSGVGLVDSVLFKSSFWKLFNFLTLGYILLVVAIFCLGNSLDN